MKWLKHKKNINNIKVDNKEIKISLLADDITLILFDLESVINSLAVLKNNSNCAGIKTLIWIRQKLHILEV